MINRLLGSTRFRLPALLLVCAATVSFCGEDELVGPTGRPLDPSGKSSPTGDPTVTATDPTGAQVDTTLVVRVLGTGYDAGSRAEFALDGQTIPQVRTNSTTFVSSKELRANITIEADAPTDLYDVIVTTSKGKRGIGIERFEVFYEAIPLGSLGGASFSRAVNARGEVAGNSQLRRRGDVENAFFWSEVGGMEDLGPGSAEGISDLAHVVGTYGTRARLWTRLGPGNWLAEDLPIPVGYSSRGNNISPSGGFIAGSAGTNPWKGAAVWVRDGLDWSLSQLPTTGEFAQANDVNDDGFVVGASDNQAFVWSRESGSWIAHPLEMPANAPNGVFVRVITAAGDVFGGTCCSGLEVRPLLWRRTTTGWSSPEEIPAIPPGSFVVSMNDSGWIAGAISDPRTSEWRAFLYQGAELLDLGTAGGSASIAWGIGPNGQIVGEATITGTTKAYMWRLP